METKMHQEKGKRIKGKSYYTYGLAVMSTVTVIQVCRCVYSIVNLGIIYKTVYLATRPAKYASSDCKAAWQLLSRW